MKQGIVTIVTPIRTGRADEAFRQHLRQLAFPGWALIGLHFASLSIIEDRKGNKDEDREGHKDDYSPHLLFEASFDGTREDFIEDLVASLGGLLDEIYQHCEG